MSKGMFVVLLILCITSILAIEPPVWPKVFSQSMTVDFGYYSTPGKFWYNYNIKAQRYDYSNGESPYTCGFILQQKTPCSTLCRNHNVYFIMPEKNLCCYIEGVQVFEPNWIESYGFKYEGDRQIDQDVYELWKIGADKYYCDKSQKRIPKRFYTGDDFDMNFWVNTYSENPIDQSVFEVPKGCTNKCTSIDKGQKQKITQFRHLKSIFSFKNHNLQKY